MRKRPITVPSEQEPSEVRERIVNAAIYVFMKYSVDQASLNMIARKAGVGHTLLLYHFQNKENLYQTVLERVCDAYMNRCEDLIARTETDEPIGRREAVDLLNKWLRCMVDALCHDLSETAWAGKIILYEYVYPSAFYEDFYASRFRRVYGAWAKIIMAVTENRDLKTAYYQLTTMYGFVVGYRLLREQLKFSLGLDCFTPDDLEWIKNRLVDIAFFMLGIGRSDGERTKKHQSRAGRTDMPPTVTSPPSHAPPRGGKASETKKRIIDGALRVFSTYSVDMASVRMIAKEAGVAASLVIYHFKTKENLYLAALDRVADDYIGRFKDLFEQVESQSSLSRPEAIEILEQWIGRMVNAFCRDFTARNWKGKIVLYEYLYPSTVYEEYYAKNLQRYHHVWVKVIAAVTGNDDRKTAFFHYAGILGQTIGLRLQRELLKRSLGMTGFSMEDSEAIKNLVIDNTLVTLGVER